MSKLEKTKKSPREKNVTPLPLVAVILTGVKLYQEIIIQMVLVPLFAFRKKGEKTG